MAALICRVGSPAPRRGRSDTIRRCGGASPLEKTRPQIEAGNAEASAPPCEATGSEVPGAPATAVQTVWPPTASLPGVLPHGQHRRDAVHARIDPGHGAGESVRNPQRPRAIGHVGGADGQRDGALQRAAGIDSPQRPFVRIREPDRAGPHRDRAQRAGGHAHALSTRSPRGSGGQSCRRSEAPRRRRSPRPPPRRSRRGSGPRCGSMRGRSGRREVRVHDPDRLRGHADVVAALVRHAAPSRAGKSHGGEQPPPSRGRGA